MARAQVETTSETGRFRPRPHKVVVESDTAPRESFRYRISLSNWESTHSRRGRRRRGELAHLAS
jgi:hypothetical protein